MKGKFITLEGPDGSGKTTVIKRVTEVLTQKGYDVVLTREPGGSPVAEKIRELLLDKNSKIDPKTEALLYASARAAHLTETVVPAISEGKIVLCDRFLDSSLAYQAFARGLGVDGIMRINEFAIGDCMPDGTVFLDLEPALGLKRINETRGHEINRLDLEPTEFHNAVYDGYKEVIKLFKERINVIDASGKIDEVVQLALAAVMQIIEK